MVPFLYDDLHSLVHEIMSWFIKTTILWKVNSGSALRKLDWTDIKNTLLCNKINIGCGATKVINSKIRTDTVIPREISKYKEECVTFLSTILDKRFERSLLKYSFTTYASSLSPIIMNRVLKLQSLYFRQMSQFSRSLVKSVYHRTESISYLGPKI